jgi:hypothetical protein
MPATNGNRTSRNNMTTATIAANIAIQNTIGRAGFMIGQCEGNRAVMSKQQPGAQNASR